MTRLANSLSGWCFSTCAHDYQHSGVTTADGMLMEGFKAGEDLSLRVYGCSSLRCTARVRGGSAWPPIEKKAKKGRDEARTHYANLITN